jgi:hypothetical protein
MAVAYVQVATQQEDQDNASASWVLTMDANTTAGNRLVLLVTNEDALVTAVSDSKGNTWSKLTDLSTTGGGHFSNAWTAHLTAALTTSDTITVTKVNAGDRPTGATAIEVSGVTSAADPKDVAVATNSGTGTSCSTGTSGTTTQNDCLAVGVWDNNNAKTFSAQTNSFTEVADFGTLAGGAGTPHHSIAYKVLTATGTQECTATRSTGAGTNWSAAIIVLRGAAAATTSFPPVQPQSSLYRR